MATPDLSAPPEESAQMSPVVKAAFACLIPVLAVAFLLGTLRATLVAP